MLFVLLATGAFGAEGFANPATSQSFNLLRQQRYLEFPAELKRFRQANTRRPQETEVVEGM